MHRLPPCPYAFPDPQVADPDGFGLICVGADLAPSTLVQAYAQGLFPWFSEGEPIRWWSPEPRCVFYPEHFTASKSLLRSARKSPYVVTLNADFHAVITHCATAVRDKQVHDAHSLDGLDSSEAQAQTWITADMIAAYNELHALGFAHSVEVWLPDNDAQVGQQNDKPKGSDEAKNMSGFQLVGGLYGIKLGAGFFGESMFHKKTDASKYAFWFLSGLCVNTGIGFIDGQLSNPHLHRLGAADIPRAQFLAELEHALTQPSPDWLPLQSRFLAAPKPVSALSDAFY